MRSAAAVSAASLANRDSSLTDPNRFFACSDTCAEIIRHTCNVYIYTHTYTINTYYYYYYV
jgi:hypothetical protein